MESPPAARPPPARRGLHALVCLVLFVGGLVVLAARLEPPPARTLDAHAREFSAARALARWRSFPASSVPHPVGSRAHEELRAAIVADLVALGCKPEVQEALVSRGNFVCAVRNVLLRFPGRTRDPAVLLAAHYDSVPAGPGAGDDGAGAACVLEIAHVLAGAPALERDVILLVDDGEELGLFGARAFCEQHRWAREVGSVVNLEARGTSGPCFLFETSDENAALIDLAADVLPRSSAWSASYEVYQRMPNDTDLSVFKAQGWQGYNLAFVRGLRHYHTPRDDALHLSPASVQQMGENALALVRGLADDRLDPDAHGRAVYADFFGLALLHWNARANLPISCVLALALGFALWTRVRAGRWRVARVLASAATALLALVLASALAWAAQAAVLAGTRSAWPPAAEPHWMRAAVVACVVASVFALAGLPWVQRAHVEERWAGVTALTALLALLISLAWPAASYLAIWPLVLFLLGFSLHEIKRERKPQGSPWMLGVPAFVAVLGVGGPLVIALEWVFEFRLCVALGFLGALVLLPLWPLVAQTPRLARALALGALAGAIALVFAARASPSWSADHPAPLSFVHYQEAESTEGRWFLESFDEELPAALAAQGFARTSEYPLGFVRGARSVFAHAATHADPIAAPERRASRAAGAPEARELRLRSTRGARMLLARLPQTWSRLSIEWTKLRADDLRPANGLVLLAGLGAEDIRLRAGEAGPATAEHLDLYEVDDLARIDAKTWLELRPVDRVPIAWGDLSVVHSALDF